MKKKAAKNVSIGDIVEISTPAGLGYVQYTHDADTEGELVRVLPGLYRNRPADFATLARQKELYFVFYIMDYAVRAGLTTVVSNQPVPGWAQEPPMMRHPASFPALGRVTRWRIISAASRLTVDELLRTPVVTELTPEQTRLSVREIWPHTAMVKELARGWTPERAEELHLKDVAEAAEKRKNQAATDDSSYTGMRHFLYFPNKKEAQEAGDLLRGRGFAVKIDRHPDGEQWGVFATGEAPKTGEQMDYLRDEMESFAARFGGEYDGWEASLDPLDSGIPGQDEKVN
jgi:hypothetical protein